MQHKILIVDDDPAARYGLKRALAALSCEIVEAADGEAALRVIARDNPDLLICDIQMPKMDGLTLVEHLTEQGDARPVVMITAYGSERIAVEAMKAGAYDYLSKPYDVDELRCSVENVLETVRLRRENETLRNEIRQHSGFGLLIGRGRAMQKVCDLIGKVAGTDATVLITGESGTGKELVARAIHEQSGRNARPFVAVNAAALPTELIESEMFGHERGAFTGATARRRGKFELADGGTLFLDEIGDMHLETQAKLLRVLQEQRFERLGGSQTVTVDVRVISATNKRPARRDRARAIPRGSLLPLESGGYFFAALAGSARGYSLARATFFGAVQSTAQQGSNRHPRRRDEDAHDVRLARQYPGVDARHRAGRDSVRRQGVEQKFAAR